MPLKYTFFQKNAKKIKRKIQIDSKKRIIVSFSPEVAFLRPAGQDVTEDIHVSSQSIEFIDLVKNDPFLIWNLR